MKRFLIVEGEDTTNNDMFVDAETPQQAVELWLECVRDRVHPGIKRPDMVYDVSAPLSAVPQVLEWGDAFIPKRKFD